jgi:ribonucleoside-diphosphate reductase beta chain
MQHYTRVFQAYEIKAMLATFAAMEVTHVRAYKVLIDTLGLPSSIHTDFLQIPEMAAKCEFLSGLQTDTPQQIAQSLAIVSAFTEGVSLFASFAVLLNFDTNLVNGRSKGKFKGMNTVVTYSMRDERLHVEAIMWLFHQFIREYPEAWTPVVQASVYAAAREVVQLEDAFLNVCFGNYRIDGLEKEQVQQYVRYVTDGRLISLGLRPIFGVTTNPFPALSWIADGVEHANFFERSSTSYSSQPTTGSWDDII